MSRVESANRLLGRISEAVEASTKILKWGFDLTDFGSQANFKKLVDEFGLTVEKETKRYPNSDATSGSFAWSGDGILIVTKNNPITGVYADTGKRDPQKGYASYIGIEGDPVKVKKAVVMIKKLAGYKDESPRKREFI